MLLLLIKPSLLKDIDVSQSPIIPACVGTDTLFKALKAGEHYADVVSL